MAAIGEYGVSLSEEGGPWHLWKGSCVALILLAQPRVRQGFAPDGVGGQGSRTWRYSCHWQSQLRGRIMLVPEAQDAHPHTRVPCLRGVAVHSAVKPRGLGVSSALGLWAAEQENTGQPQARRSASCWWSESCTLSPMV